VSAQAAVWLLADFVSWRKYSFLRIGYQVICTPASVYILYAMVLFLWQMPKAIVFIRLMFNNERRGLPRLLPVKGRMAEPGQVTAEAFRRRLHKSAPFLIVVSFLPPQVVGCWAILFAFQIYIGYYSGQPLDGVRS
jgi:hypothetical protein